MKLSIFIVSLIFLMVLGGCASSTHSIDTKKIQKMSLEQFLKEEAGYKYIDAIQLYQKREKSSFRGKDGKVRPDAYCSAIGGKMVRMKDVLDFPDKSDYYPFDEKVANLFKEKVEWVKNSEKYDLHLDNSNLKIARFGQYCMVSEKPIFFYYTQPFKYFDGYTDIVVETSKDKLNNLKKSLYDEPLNQCLNYLNIANSMTVQWNRAIKEKKELLDTKEKIQKRENKYSKELANAVILTPQSVKHIPLVSERLFSAIAKDYNKMQVTKIKAKFDSEEQAINAEYAIATKPIQDQINQIDISFNDESKKFKKLNARYLMSLGIVQDFEMWKRNNHQKDFPKYEEKINNYYPQEAYNIINQVCGSFADKKQKIVEGE